MKPYKYLPKYIFIYLLIIYRKIDSDSEDSSNSEESDNNSDTESSDDEDLKPYNLNDDIGDSNKIKTPKYIRYEKLKKKPRKE